MWPDVLAKNGANISTQPVRVIVAVCRRKLEETFVASLSRKLMAAHFVPHQKGADGPGNFSVLVRIASGAQRSLVGLVDGACLDEREGYRHREIISNDPFEIVLIDAISERVIHKT